MTMTGPSRIDYVCIAIVLLMAVSVFLIYRSAEGDLKFNAVEWNGHAGDKNLRDKIRYRMVDDLVDNHLPVGMSESEVIALIGKPSRPLSDEGFAGWNLFDHYGRYGEMEISIKFDADRRIRNVSIYTE